MKNKLLIIILSTLFIFSCKKDAAIQKAIPPQIASNTTQVIVPDNISYVDIIPDKELQSVMYTTFVDHQICTAYIPTPTDSTVNYDLDLDSNQIMDFRITLTHSPYNGYCGHCPTFTYRISFSGLAPGDSTINYFVAKIFAVGDTIKPANNNWVKVSYPVMEGDCGQGNPSDFTTGFIGFKINNSVGYIHVDRLPNNGIRIREYAFNKTPYNSITCGQH